MSKQKTILDIAAKTHAALTQEAARLLAVAQQNPLTIGAVHRAIEAAALAEGYGRAIAEMRGMLLASEG